MPTTATTQQDHQLALRIERALRRDERLSSQPLEVDVSGGHARLHGTVQSYRRKLAAIQIAASFEGCRDVVDEIVIQPALVPDADLADSVRHCLESCADLTREAITVSARGGVVTLTGHAATLSERTLAQDIAMGVRGARDIENQILVDLAQQEHDESLAADLGDAMSQTRGMKDTDIHVAVNSAAIVLSGTVPHLWQKEMAESVAARYRPGMLRNEITVD